MYFTGTVEKNNTYASTLAGNQQSSPAKNRVEPTKPSDIGMPNDKMRPRLSQGIRIHQIGMIGASQNGQLRYGRFCSPFPSRRSHEQFGQAVHDFFPSAPPRSLSWLVKGIARTLSRVTDANTKVTALGKLRCCLPD